MNGTNQFDRSTPAAPAAAPANADARAWMRRNLWPGVGIVAATVAVEVCAYLGAAAVLPSSEAAVLALLTALAWVILAGPVFAASGRTVLESLVRGGLTADAGVVVLVVLMAGQAGLTFASAVKVYLLWAAVAVAESFFVALAVDAVRRHALAAAAVIVLALVSAEPFWANGLVMRARGSARDHAAFIVAVANPVLATARCLDERVPFVWNEKPIVYEHTVLGRDVPMPAAPWYLTVIGFGGAGLGLALAAGARRRRPR